MKKIFNYISDNWIWIITGLLFTQFAVVKCYEQRRGFYIGGEWFILPIFLMLKYLFETMILYIKEICERK